MSTLFPTHRILENKKYFAITIGADESGNLWSETQTMWCGFADKERRVELREIRLVNAIPMADIWVKIKQPFHVVNNPTDFVQWKMNGGHALITEEMTLECIPEEMGPKECVCEGSYGFTEKNTLPKTAFQKAPTPKLRMKVLKRDEYRCMICGQRPSDDVNIKLHTHHIRPHAKRGVTTPENLITLCHTCHEGLDPHYEFNLFSIIEKEYSNHDGQLTQRMQKKYLENIKNYRKTVLLIVDSLR